MVMRAPTENDKLGILFKREAAQEATVFDISRPAPTSHRAVVGIGDSLSFAGVYLFTFLLYARPNELFPGIFGAFPMVKIVALTTALIYVASRLSQGRPLTNWSLELRMVILMVLLAVLFMPFAASPRDTIDTLSDTFLKIVLIFALMINLVNSFERLHSLLKLMLVCGSVIAVSCIREFLAGNLSQGRIWGPVGGMLNNPNDIAAALDLLLPLAVALALSNKGLFRLTYAACALLMGTAVVFTFSRGGFLGLMALAGILLLKLSRRSRLIPVVLALLVGGALALLMPTNYGDRLLTIFQPTADKTGSAQQRQLVLQRAALVAARHSLIGVGMGNFHIYSLGEAAAHNAYLEIWAELGMAGLIAYLTLIFAPHRSLQRLELKTFGEKDHVSNESYYLSIGLQATLVAYIVCSFFASIQYQWFLYYPVAFAVALRRIYDLETMESTQATVKTAAPGTLWSDYKRIAVARGPVSGLVCGLRK